MKAGVLLGLLLAGCGVFRDHSPGEDTCNQGGQALSRAWPQPQPAGEGADAAEGDLVSLESGVCDGDGEAGCGADTGLPDPDANTPDGDFLVAPPDAGSPVDATAPDFAPEPDAGAPDAGAPDGALEYDAGSPDAAPPPPPDSSVGPDPDPGQPEPDSGGISPRFDAGVNRGDGGLAGGGGCKEEDGCSTAPAGGWLASLLMLLGLGRRTRRRGDAG